MADYANEFSTNIRGLIFTTDPKHQAAALLVRSAQGGWNENEAIDLARHLLELHHAGAETGLASDALAIVTNQEVTGRPVDSLLIHLYTTLPATAWKLRGEVMAALQTQQRRHLSGKIPQTTL